MSEDADHDEEEDAGEVLYSSDNGQFEVVVGDYGRGRQEMEFQLWSPKPDDPERSVLEHSFTFPSISDGISSAIAILDRYAPHRLRR